MHTTLVLLAGFVLLAACAGVGRGLAGRHGVARAMLVFLPLWLIGAGANMYVGVAQAGYSVADEAPIFLVIFSVPSAAALLIWFRQRHAPVT